MRSDDNAKDASLFIALEWRRELFDSEVAYQLIHMA